MIGFYVAVNELGRRVGDSHHNAKLTNSEVDHLLDLRDQGLSYSRLARHFEVSKSLARDICKGLKRCQTATAWRRIQGE